MSIVPKETIEVIAQSVGISNLSLVVLPALAADVEYRVREIMQEAIKCMRHSRRTTLSADDVDSALSLRNVEPIYGFASGDPMRFRRAAGHKDLFYIEEKDVEFKEVIEAPLPKAPLDTAIVAHWLAIEGVQPAIPENPPLEALQVLSVPSDSRKTEAKEDGVPVDIRLPIKHVLSRELQLYFEKITELTLGRSESPLFKEALVSLATDSGIHPLVPYFTFFIADEVSRNLNSSSLLFALMRLVRSLLRNPHIHIEPYLHQLMPSVMTCLVARRLGHKLSDNHWGLRKFTANLVASICKRFGHVYHNLQTRVTTTLLHAFLDPSKALPQHYGAIQGLAALGPNVVRLLVLPNLEPYLLLLKPEMQLEKQKNEMKRHEAWLVYGAIMISLSLENSLWHLSSHVDREVRLGCGGSMGEEWLSTVCNDVKRAAGLCIYDRLKMLPSVPSPPARTFWKINNKVLTTSNKRKANMDNMMQQPPLKKLVADNSMFGATGSGKLTPDSNLQQQRTSMTNFVAGGSSGRKEMLLPLLYEYFGESMLSFVPSTPQASLFL